MTNKKIQIIANDDNYIYGFEHYLISRCLKNIWWKKKRFDEKMKNLCNCRIIIDFLKWLGHFIDLY